VGGTLRLPPAWIICPAVDDVGKRNNLAHKYLSVIARGSDVAHLLDAYELDEISFCTSEDGDPNV
jgi:hypothetical protein